MKSGNLNFLEPSGLLQACNGAALPLPFTFTRKINLCNLSNCGISFIKIWNMKFVQSDWKNKYKRHVEYQPSKCPSSFHNNWLCFLIVFFKVSSWTSVLFERSHSEINFFCLQVTWYMYSAHSQFIHCRVHVHWVTQFTTDSLSIFHLNECMHEYFQSRTVTPSQWSWDICEWMDGHKNALVKCLFI